MGKNKRNGNYIIVSKEKFNDLFARPALIVGKQFQPSDGYQHEKQKMIFFDDKENSD